MTTTALAPLVLLPLALAPVALPAAEPCDPDLIPEARAVLAYLESIYGKKTLVGQDKFGEAEEALAASGRSPAIVSVDLSGWHEERWSPQYRRTIQNAVDRSRAWWVERGGIVSFAWHWANPLGDEGTFRATRPKFLPIDVGEVVTPGTEAHRRAMEDLRWHADYLEQLAVARVPVLWRPLHEIEGGWFWWSDAEHPEHTAELWRMVYRYLVEERGLHNLIWVYSSALKAGDRGKDVEAIDYRRRFYPGDEYVDIAGIDIYINSWFGWPDYRESAYRKAFDIIHRIAPTKMHALCECQGLPAPELLGEGGPRWLYCLPWYVGDKPTWNPPEWVEKVYPHGAYITLDELPWLPPAPLPGFSFVLSAGYGGVDHLPQDPVVFENLLVNMKEAGFNVLHGVHRKWRADLCRQHGVRLMVDVLAWKEGAETDIRRGEPQRDRVRAICREARDDPAIWGYNLWNERLDFFGRPDGKGVEEYLALLRKWDPSHPVWVGTYRNYFLDRLPGSPGVFGYYDYHWQRGMGYHFPHLDWYRRLAAERVGSIGRWVMGSDYARNAYTLHTSIAFGLKTVIWFIGGPFDEKGDVDPSHRFHHLVRLGRETKPLYRELSRIGRPVRVVSTPTTRTPDDREKEPGVPPPLAAPPADSWLEIESGEAVVGMFRYPTGEDGLWIANHNAMAGQSLRLRIRREGPIAVEIFDRRTESWRPLPQDGETFVMELAPAGGELVRVRRSERPETAPSSPDVHATEPQR